LIKKKGWDHLIRKISSVGVRHYQTERKEIDLAGRGRRLHLDRSPICENKKGERIRRRGRGPGTRKIRGFVDSRETGYTFFALKKDGDRKGNRRRAVTAEHFGGGGFQIYL